MPKSLLSDDPFAAPALDDRGRRPASTVLLLVIPALGFTLMAVGMHSHPRADASPLAVSVERPSRCETMSKQFAEIETARRKLLHWQHENCCGAATPRSRMKEQMWRRGYRQRLAVFARMFPERTCPKEEAP